MSIADQYARLMLLDNPGATPGMPRIPLISEILPDLWLGGCVPGAHLPDDFRYVLSCTPDRYELEPSTERLEYPFVDGSEVPPGAVLALEEGARRCLHERREDVRIRLHAS